MIWDRAASATDEPVADPRHHPAAAVAVLAAFLVGVGAVGASSVLSSAWLRVLLAVALIAIGWTTSTRSHPALGTQITRGIGTSFTVLGADLLGLALLTAATPESPIAVILMVYGIPALALLVVARTGMRAWTAGAGAILPMLAVLLLATAEVPTAPISITMLAAALALSIVVIRAPATWADLASSAAAMSASFAFGAGTSPFGSLGATQTGGATAALGALTGGAQTAVAAGGLLVAAVVLLMAVLRRDLAGGVLAASLFTMPPVLLQSDPPFGTWPAATQAVLTAIPLLTALTALAAFRSYTFRRTLLSIPKALHEHTAEDTPEEPPRGGGDGDSVGERAAEADEPNGRRADGRTGEGVASAGPGGDGSAGERAAEADEPEGGGLDGVTDEPLAARHHPREPGGQPADEDAGAERVDHRRAARQHVSGPSDAVSAAACAVVVAAAAVVFVTLAMPVFGWEARAQGAVAVVVLVGVGALAYWLPGTPGAAASVVTLLGLGLASPWALLLSGGTITGDLLTTGIVDLLAAAVTAWLLLRRHPHVAVFAAAAYTLAGSIAAFLGSLLFNPGYLSGQGEPFAGEWAPVLIVALPLLLLAIPAAIVAFGRWAAVGQAVGAVAVAAAGFLPMKVMVGEFATGTGDGLPPGYVLQLSLGPLTPSDWLATSTALRSVTGPALVAVIATVVVALVLAASLARRPHAPLVAAITLVLLSAVQASLLTTLSVWSPREAETLGWVLGGGALVAAAVAVVVTGAAARRS